MASFYDLLTSSARLNRLVNRSSTLIGLANQAPVPVRFSDGRRRLATFRLLRLARLSAEVEEETQLSFAAYDGGDVLDIGASLGWYSAMLAPKAREGDVLVSFEPDPVAYRELIHNLATLTDLFPGPALMPVPTPVGDGRAAAITFPEGSGHPRFESAADADGPGTTTVDDFVDRLGLRPAFAKIDVEGAEHPVLSGMERTLSEFRPAVMLEVHPHWQPAGITVEDVEAVMSGHGYRRLHVQPSELAVRQWWRHDG